MPAVPGFLCIAVTWPATGQPTNKVYGDAKEASKRINVVIVPDGYKTTDKATMEAHAQSLVNEFNGTTPWKEHTNFFNYILVYAYPKDSGTTQCDCNILENTAMSTFFPKDNPTCKDKANRCLYYGSPPCNPGSANNIAAAEMRAPAHDATIVMVNTTRYGGCGGSRAVYSAGNASAKQIGLHELGHSLGLLADEYAYENTCGTSAGEINTSKYCTKPAPPATWQLPWEDWVKTIGNPRIGAQYHQRCLCRPEPNCLMRELGKPLCHVCNQQWSLRILGSSNVKPTAVISAATPDPTQFVRTTTNTPVNLSITTRFAAAPATNTVAWAVTGGSVPCFSPPVPTTNNYSPSFSCSGTFTVRVTATADTNFIKAAKKGRGPEIENLDRSRQLKAKEN